MFRSALLILSGNAVTSLLLLARNLIIARLIPVEDYGIASTFAIAMAVIEMLSAFGLQQQIIQSKEGDDPHFQAALQGFQVLRGVVSATLLLALAGPIAAFMQVPEVAWAYRMMALIPLLNALVHFDIHRSNRLMKFWPVVLTGGVSALVSVLAVWPLSLWMGDYRVMLYAIAVQSVFSVGVSHLMAERPYRLVFDRAIMTQSLRFGWPLMINGVLLFAVFNGDKLIVGRELGMAVLAIFSMGFTLTLPPTLVMAKSVGSFFLPQLSAVQGNAKSFQILSSVTLQAVLGFGLLIVVIVVLVGNPVAHLLLGDKYLELLSYLTWFAIMQAVRVSKAGPAIVALALGHTGNAALSNLGRVLSLPLCWYVAITTGDLRMIIWIALAGEGVGYITAVLLLKYKSKAILRGLLWPHVMAAGILFTSAAYALWADTAHLPQVAPLWLWIVFALFLGLALWTSQELLRYLVRRGADDKN